MKHGNLSLSLIACVLCMGVDCGRTPDDACEMREQPGWCEGMVANNCNVFLEHEATMCRDAEPCTRLADGHAGCVLPTPCAEPDRGPSRWECDDAVNAVTSCVSLDEGGTGLRYLYCEGSTTCGPVAGDVACR